MGKLGWALVCALVLVGTACGDNSKGAGSVSVGSDGSDGFAGAGAHGIGTPPIDIGALVIGLSLTPDVQTFTLADHPSVMAIGNLASGGRIDVTSEVTWSTGTDGIVSIANGQLSGLAVGSTSIAATMGDLTADGQITVTPAAAVVASLSVSADNATLPTGATMQYHATAAMTDGTRQDVTAQAAWSVAPSTIATIDSSGIATGTHTGAGTVSATWHSATGSVPLVVTSAQLVRVDLDPAAFAVAAGYTKTATATAVYNDGSTLDVTALAQWAATPTAIATAAPLGIVTGHAAGSATLSATFGAVTGTAAVTVTAAQLIALEISPPVIAIALGTDLQLTATGLFSDGSHEDMTTQVIWTSNAIGSALVSTTGKVTSQSVGVALITAQVGTIAASELAVITNATLTQIQLPSTLTLPTGRSATLLPIGVYSDGSTAALTSNITFATSNAAIASVSADGKITANGPGTVTITVTSGAISAQVQLTITSAALVSVLVTPVAITLTAGATAQMAAMGTYSDASVVDLTSQGAWSVAAPATATVSNANASKGLVTGVAPGLTAVTVTVGGITATAVVQVTAATLTDLFVTPPALVLPTGTEAYLVATAHYSDLTTLDLTTQVTWTSSDPTVATVSNAAGTFGHVSAKAAGSATITATKGSVTKDVTITVTPAVLQAIQLPAFPLTIPRGLTAPVIALGVYSDGSVKDITTTVAWTSDAPAVASVSNLIGSLGVVTGNTVGTATLTATYNGKASTVGVTVTNSILQSITLPSTLTVPKGLTLPVLATGLYSDGSTADITASVTWSSSAPAIASVSNLLGSLGLVTGNTVGDATLTATYQGKSSTVAVHVSAALLSSISLGASTMTVPRGLTLPIIATGTYSDGSTADLTASVVWTSSAPAVATVSSLVLNAGLITGVSQGSATITATLGASSSTTAVTVTSAVLTGIELPTTTITVPRGLSLPVTAMGVYSDGSLADITANGQWTSSAPQIASVSGLAGSIGIVTGVAVGDATLTVALNGKTATVPVHVTSAILSAIQLPAAAMTVPKGLTLPILATGVYSDGSTADLTSSVTWTSSAPGVASVSGLIATAGLVTGVTQGTATITATLGSASSTTAVTVTNAILSGLQLPQAAVTVPKGLTLPLVVTGLYSDGSLADLTSTVTWTSSAPAVATVSGLAGSAGLVTGISQGSATVIASVNGKSASAAVTVTAAVLSGIQLPTTTVIVPKGLSAPVIATGVYSDGSIADITSSVTWSSSAPAIASVSGLAGSLGVVTGNGVGDASITATLGAQSQTVPVHVTAALLSAISLPATMTVPRGLTLPVIATGLYTDGSTADLTTSVTWSTSAPATATVSGLVGSAGLVTGVAQGSATITATLGSKSSTTAVTVTAAVLSSIQLPTTPVMVAKGLFAPILATGLYSDGSVASLTQNVTWTSSAPSIATVSNLVASAGIVTGVQTGFATITATLGARSATVQVQVTPAILSNISVNVPQLLGLLQIGAATATGTYSDGTTADLTSQVTFGSSNPLAATVTANGSLLGLALGNTTITATLGSLTGSSLISVGSDTCHLVINEIKAGSLFKLTDDFVEIYNPCTFAADVSQVSLVYRDTFATTDTLLVALAGSIPANSYRIYVGSQYSNGGTTDGSFTTDIGGLIGAGVGLRMAGTGTLIDSVAWGVTANGLNEGVLVGVISLGQTLGRIPNGRDTNSNLADFGLLSTPSPRAANQ